MSWNGEIIKVNMPVDERISEYDNGKWVMDYMPCGYSFYPYKEIKKYICPSIKKVIFNYPATVVYWEDSSKTVVKVFTNFDDWEPEKGVLLCMMKKMYGKGYYKQLKKWCE